ncbi:MAG: cysteine hydrolase family protein [Comamonas sp.]
MTSTRRALLVIDVQNEYISGNLPIAFPDPQQALTHIGRAMDAARAHGLPVVVVQNLAPAGSPLFSTGSEGAALHPVVAGRPHDLLLTKSMPSAFTGTTLESWVAAQGITTLVVTGFMTHNCDDATIKHAVHLGLDVEFLSDASGSVPYANRAGQASAEEIHRVFSVVLQSRFAAVMDTTTWLALLQSGGKPVRENIHQSHQNARGIAAAA